MNKIFLYSVFIMSVVALSCSKTGFLDNKNDTSLDETAIFSDSTKTMGFLSKIYGDILCSYAKSRWSANKGNLEQACDEAEYKNIGGTESVLTIIYGTMNPSNSPFNDVWIKGYQNIRRVNIFLNKIDAAPLSQAMRDRTKGEARFLRAWYYSILVKTFAGVPILKEMTYGITDDINVPRNTYEECVDYIVKELDTAATLLPTSYPQALDYGRPTKGACLALKSRVLLYAASPLFNGGAITEATAEQKPLVSYMTADPNRWKKALDASEEVINLNTYQLVGQDGSTMKGFYEFFVKARNTPEHIFVQVKPNNHDLENFYNPSTRGGSWFSSPTQGLVDAFTDKNGIPINAAGTVYSADNPYANRDPRLAFTVIYNGRHWYDKQQAKQVPVYTYVGGGLDAISLNTPYTATMTGYYVAKMCDTTATQNNTVTVPRDYPLIRYAEILLNAAEARNEWEGPTQRVYDLLVIIRKRAGILPGANNMYGLTANMTKDQMRAVIQNERRVELAFEEHRFWDVRRWKIAETTENTTSQGMKITYKGTGSITNGTSFTYEKINVRKHNFRQAFYIMPISQSEMGKMSKLIQNPGW